MLQGILVDDLVLVLDDVARARGRPGACALRRGARAARAARLHLLVTSRRGPAVRRSSGCAARARSSTSSGSRSPFSVDEITATRVLVDDDAGSDDDGGRWRRIHAVTGGWPAAVGSRRGVSRRSGRRPWRRSQRCSAPRAAVRLPRRGGRVARHRGHAERSSRRRRPLRSGSTPGSVDGVGLPMRAGRSSTLADGRCFLTRRHPDGVRLASPSTGFAQYASPTSPAAAETCDVHGQRPLVRGRGPARGTRLDRRGRRAHGSRRLALVPARTRRCSSSAARRARSSRRQASCPDEPADARTASGPRRGHASPAGTWRDATAALDTARRQSAAASMPRWPGGMGLVHGRPRRIPRGPRHLRRGRPRRQRSPRRGAARRAWTASARYHRGDVGDSRGGAAERAPSPARPSSATHRALAGAHAALGMTPRARDHDPMPRPRETRCALGAAERAGDAFLVVRIRIHDGSGPRSRPVRRPGASSRTRSRCRPGRLRRVPRPGPDRPWWAHQGLARFEEALADFAAARGPVRADSARAGSPTPTREGQPAPAPRGELVPRPPGLRGRGPRRRRRRRPPASWCRPWIGLAPRRSRSTIRTGARLVRRRALELDDEIDAGPMPSSRRAGSRSPSATATPRHATRPRARRWPGRAATSRGSPSPSRSQALRPSTRRLALARLADARRHLATGRARRSGRANRLVLGRDRCGGARGRRWPRTPSVTFRLTARAAGDRGGGREVDLDREARPAVAIQSLGGFGRPRRRAGPDDRVAVEEGARPAQDPRRTARPADDPRDVHRTAAGRTRTRSRWPTACPSPWPPCGPSSTRRSAIRPSTSSPPRSTSIALDLDHVELDIERFLDEAAAAARARGPATQAEARAALEAAEALYGGDFLEEDPYEDWAVATARGGAGARTSRSRGRSPRRPPMPATWTARPLLPAHPRARCVRRGGAPGTGRPRSWRPAGTARPVAGTGSTRRRWTRSRSRRRRSRRTRERRRRSVGGASPLSERGPPAGPGPANCRAPAAGRRPGIVIRPPRRERSAALSTDPRPVAREPARPMIAPATATKDVHPHPEGEPRHGHDPDGPGGCLRLPPVRAHRADVDPRDLGVVAHAAVV